MSAEMTMPSIIRYSAFIAAGVVLLASCLATETLTYQGKTGGSAPLPVYTRQEAFNYKLRFIGNTHRITLADNEKTRVIDYVKQQDIHTFLQAQGVSIIFSETDRAGKLFVQAGTDNADVWDLTTGKLVHSFKPVSSRSKYTRLSPDGKVLFFDNRLWDVTKAESVMELESEPTPNSAEFSADGRYFVLGGRTGTQWLDLQTKKMERLPTERKISQVLFGRDQRLYRSYGVGGDASLFGMNADDGYWMGAIAVSRLGDKKLLATFEPRSRIACWIILPNQQLFAALTDHTLVWLDEDLKIKKQWRSELDVTACLPDKHNEVWLGTDKSGLLKLNLEQGLLKQVLPYTHGIESVKLSLDENYLGLVARPDGSSRVEIYNTADLQ